MVIEKGYQGCSAQQDSGTHGWESHGCFYLEASAPTSCTSLANSIVEFIRRNHDHLG